MNPNSCPTVAIKTKPSAQNPTGIVVINESDFDSETMKKADATIETEANATVETEATVETAQEAAIQATGKTAKAVAPWAAAK